MADGAGHPNRKRAKLFMHGGSQAVRLPKEFRFEGKEVSIRREADAVIMEPVKTDWPAFWAELDRMRAGRELRLVAPDDPPAEEVPTQR